MARLPQVGGDTGNWGDILNDFLLQSHKADGSLKDGSITTPQLSDDAVTSAKLADNAVDTANLQDNSVSEPKLAAQNSPTAGDFLSWNGSAMRWAAQAAAPVTSVAGKTGAVTLTKSDVGLSNVDNTSDANKPISTATQSALDGKQAVLTSGTNIKTVNGTTLLGSGNIAVPVGDVVGPASSTDKAIARYSGTTGKAIQDTTVTIDDNGYLGVTSGTIYLNATSSAVNVPSSAFLRFGTSDIKKPHVLVIGDAYSTTPGKVSLRYGVSGASFDYVDGANNPATKMSLDTAGNLTTTGTINGRDVAADATKIVNNGMGVVVHGATASTARPTGFACITWIGSVQPTNAATNDIWVYKA